MLIQLTPRTTQRLRAIILFTFLTAVFALAYTQPPLYTSNQNQYFLHALARTGAGYLEQDWLANTLDPTPVFSGLAEITYRLLRLPAVFYLYYALLMGVYLYSLVGIADHIYRVRKSTTTYLAYLALLIVVHSAALRFAISRTLGDNWSYVLEDGVADQRLMGPVFQPSTFGVLLLLSIYLFLQRRPIWAVLSAVLAATIHPTYLLSAGTLTLAFILAMFKQERRMVRPILVGLVALLAVSPVLAYVYTNFGNTPAETTAQARQILVHFRIPHHALISWWFDATAVVKICLVLCALYLVRKTDLFLLLLVPTLVATGLTVVQVLTQSDMLALIFPWRLSTFLVPLSTALTLAYLLTATLARFPNQTNQSESWIRLFSLAAIVLAVLIGVLRMKLDFARQATRDDQPVMAFVAANKHSGATYLIPIKMQDFRLATESPAFVDFKAIPYQDADVLEWYQRIELADHFYKERDCNLLDDPYIREHVTHVVLPLKTDGEPCPQLHQVYRDPSYGLYSLETP